MANNVVTGVNVSGSVATLTLTDTIANSTDDVKVSYAPGTLVDHKGNALPAFTDETVTNNVP